MRTSAAFLGSTGTAAASAAASPGTTSSIIKSIKGGGPRVLNVTILESFWVLKLRMVQMLTAIFFYYKPLFSLENLLFNYIK